MKQPESDASERAELYLIHKGDQDLQPLFEPAPNRRLIALEWSERAAPPAGSLILLYLGDEQLRELVPLAVEKQWQVGVLPHPRALFAAPALGVEGDVQQVASHYLQSEPIDAGVLVCNDQAVFSSVVIGEVLDLGLYDVQHPPTRMRALASALKALRDLRLRSYRLTTGKEQKIQLGALGILVMEQTQSALSGCYFSEALNLSDGRVTLLALAPRSILGYLRFLMRLLLPKKLRLSRLPTSVGLMRSDRILVEASRGTDYALDGTLASAKSIEFRILEQRLRLLPGPALLRKEERRLAKDTIKMNHLPVGESARQLAEMPLPLFSHASEEDYRDLFVSLRENAVPSSPFLTLMVLSVLLALTGLYASSAPVIIGAMILAPLMAPIVSFAMGLARTDASLIRGSLRTLAVGIGSGLFCAVAVASLMPLAHLTPEMQARLSPTLLDLSVAVLSGIAGAYAHAREEVAKSLAGVAIAVALVPPLSVAGIGIGWGDWTVARGAFLLFATNLVGISLAASATFLAMGFAPFKHAKKGLAITLGMLALIIVPLYLAFIDLVEQERIARKIPSGEIELAGERVDVRTQEVRMGSPPLVRVVLSSPRLLDKDHVDALKQRISERVGKEVLLEAQLNLRR